MENESLFRFLPLAGRGEAVDRAVRAQLVSSLASLYAQTRPFIKYDEGALQALLNDIRSVPVRPAVFGTYTELVESIYADDADTAQRLSDLLLNIQAPCADTKLVTLTDHDLGPDQAQRYARLVDDDPEEQLPLQAVAEMTSGSSSVEDALFLVEAAASDLGREIRGLAREIVLVAPASSPLTGEIVQFDGASTFYLWGSVFVRTAGRSRVDLAQTLAHETGHLLLFGLMMGCPLVENTYSDRYTSPLRQDPRPMEGLVHAAYVLARMHYCLACLISSGLLSTDEQTKAQMEMGRHHSRFHDALETIQERAQFTPAGAEIFDNAVEYMKAVDLLPANA